MPMWGPSYKKFGNEESASKIKISIDTLIAKKMNQVESKKYKFEYRGNSRRKAFSGNSGLSGFHRGYNFNNFLIKISDLSRRL